MKHHGPEAAGGRWHFPWQKDSAASSFFQVSTASSKPEGSENADPLEECGKAAEALGENLWVVVSATNDSKPDDTTTTPPPVIADAGWHPFADLDKYTRDALAPKHKNAAVKILLLILHSPQHQHRSCITLTYRPRHTDVHQIHKSRSMF